MKILMTGATGFVGQKLCESLFEQGHDLFVITRSRSSAAAKISIPHHPIEINLSNSSEKTFDEKTLEKLKEIDLVVNLMGENIAASRWSVQQKSAILESRVRAVKNLTSFIHKYCPDVRKVISSSAIGFYPNSLTEKFDEESAPGDNFLSTVTQKWEEAWSELRPAINLCILRIGVVLDFEGGMYQKLLPLYRLGLGGPIGLGQRFLSWIHRKDLVQMIIFLMDKDQTNQREVYNAVAPEVVTNKKFNGLMAKLTQRPALFAVPPMILKIILGEMSQVVLSSQSVSSEKIESLGFVFRFKTLDKALEEITAYHNHPPSKSVNFHYKIEKSQWVPLELEECFEFFSRSHNLEKITPEFLNFKVLSQSDEVIQDGTSIKYQLSLHGIPIRWHTIIEKFVTNEKFVDFQKSGPYQVWYHQHHFVPLKRGGTLIKDTVHYRLPIGWLGDTFGKWKVAKDVAQIFSYRFEIIKNLMGPK
jgi:hypothetical protein